MKKKKKYCFSFSKHWKKNKLVEYSCRMDLCFLKKSDSVFQWLLKKLLRESHLKDQKLFMDILKIHFSIEKWSDRIYQIVLFER